jgi:hypothetical protein
MFEKLAVIIPAIASLGLLSFLIKAINMLFNTKTGAKHSIVRMYTEANGKMVKSAPSAFAKGVVKNMPIATKSRAINMPAIKE